MAKTKTYVITLSEFFPATHRRAGQPTDFRAALITGQTCARCKEKKPAMCLGECFTGFRKRHTIRANYPLWEKRVSEIQAGKAILSVRQWTGKPYRSKQREIAQLTAADGIGIDRLEFVNSNLGLPRIGIVYQRKHELAHNDGLTFEDWEEWFKDYDLSKPLAIIHFTKFRYEQ